jgi:hypothetical protein
MVGEALDEYGTISMSSPLVAAPRADSSTFSFELTKKAQDYFDSAKTDIEASSASLTQEMNDAGVGVKVQADLGTALGTVSDLSAYASNVASFQARQTAQEAAARAGAQQILAAVPANASAADRAKAEAASQQYLADHLPGPTSQPAYPATRPGSLPGLDSDVNQSASDKAKDVFSSVQFSKLRELLGKNAPTLSNRAAINIAAGDTATAAIFSVLGNPAKYSAFKDKRMLAGVAMVSVAPGRKTQQHYAGDIALTVRYEWHLARSEAIDAIASLSPKRPGRGVAGVVLPEDPQALAARLIGLKKNNAEVSRHGDLSALAKVHLYGNSSPYLPTPQEREGTGGGSGDASSGEEGSSPLVMAVSPMTDVEVRDVTNGARQQKAFALTLAAALEFAGLKGQANVFDKWAKRFESEIETRSPSAAISAYSHSGGTFGFQIGPRLRAIAAAKSGGPLSDSILERQTFPVLILIGMDEADLTLRVVHVKEGEKDKELVFERVLVFSESMRWQPLDSHARSIPESGRLKLLSTMAQAAEAIPPSEDAAGNNPVARYARGRAEVLTYQSVGSSNWQYLPVEIIGRQPQVAYQEFAPVSINGVHTLVVQGEHLTGATGATVGGKAATVNNMGDETVLVTVDATAAGLEADKDYEVVVGFAESTVHAGRVQFTPEKGKEAQEKSYMTIGRDGSGRVTSLDFHFPTQGDAAKPQDGAPALTKEEVLKIMTTALEADQARLQLNASGGFDYHVQNSAQVSPATEPAGH